MERKYARFCARHGPQRLSSTPGLRLLRHHCKLCRLRSCRRKTHRKVGLKPNLEEHLVPFSRSVSSIEQKISVKSESRAANILASLHCAEVGCDDAAHVVESMRSQDLPADATPSLAARTEGVKSISAIAKARNCIDISKMVQIAEVGKIQRGVVDGVPNPNMSAVKTMAVPKRLTSKDVPPKDTQDRADASAQGRTDLEQHATTDPYIDYDASSDACANAEVEWARAGISREHDGKLQVLSHVKSLLGEGFAKATPRDMVKELQTRGFSPSQIKEDLLARAKAVSLTAKSYAGENAQHPAAWCPNGVVGSRAASNLLVTKSALRPRLSSANEGQPSTPIYVPKLPTAPLRPGPYLPSWAQLQQPNYGMQSNHGAWAWPPVAKPWQNLAWPPGVRNIAPPQPRYISPCSTSWPPPPPPSTQPSPVKRMYILDGMNLLRHTNSLVASDCLQWEQLKAAGSYYKRQGHSVLVFLPRSLDKYSMEVESIRHNIGLDSVVFTPSGCSDDKFMINYSRDVDGCRIVTNDMFRDHTVSGDWVKHRTIKFAFAASRFIPEDVHK